MSQHETMRRAFAHFLSVAIICAVAWGTAVLIQRVLPVGWSHRSTGAEPSLNAVCGRISPGMPVEDALRKIAADDATDQIIQGDKIHLSTSEEECTIAFDPVSGRVKSALIGSPPIIQ